MQNSSPWRWLCHLPAQTRVSDKEITPPGERHLRSSEERSQLQAGQCERGCRHLLTPLGSWLQGQELSLQTDLPGRGLRQTHLLQQNVSCALPLGMLGWTMKPHTVS